MRGPPLGPGGEDINRPDHVAPRRRMASSTRKIKPKTSNLICSPLHIYAHVLIRLHSTQLGDQ